MVRTLFEWLFGGVQVGEASERQQQGALLVDVRQRDEWQAGHAPGAHHIPLDELQSQLSRMPRDREILFICQAGMRSARAVAWARQAGLARAANVRGGMAAWQRSGLPVEQAPNRRQKRR